MNIINKVCQDPYMTINFQRSMTMLGKPLSIIYEDKKVNVKAEADFTLIVNDKKFDITAGEHTINI